MPNLLTLSYGTHPEIMEATLKIMAEAGAVLEIETIPLGDEPRKLGYESGFEPESLKKIIRSHTLLKTPDDVTPNLCSVLEIGDAREIYGEPPHTAQCFANDVFAIFEPVEPTTQAMLNAAIMALCRFNQIDAAKRIAEVLINLPPEDEIDVEFFVNKLVFNS